MPARSAYAHAISRRPMLVLISPRHFHEAVSLMTMLGMLLMAISA